MSSIPPLSALEIDAILSYNVREEFLDVVPVDGAPRIVKIRYDEAGCLPLCLRSCGAGPFNPKHVTARLNQFAQVDVSTGTYEFRFEDYGPATKDLLSKKIQRLYKEATEDRKLIEIKVYG